MAGIKIAAVAILCLVIGLGTGIGINLTVNDPFVDLDRAMNDTAMEDRVVDIGVLLPLTGGQSTHGTENTAGVMLAIDDLNEYFETVGSDRRLHGISEDTATSPVVALEKLEAFNARDIQLILGPETSAEIRNVKGYADSNGMLMFSPSSTAPSLAIPDDSVYRMVSDDALQGPALASLVLFSDKQVMIPVWRGDAWGDGISGTATEKFAQLGGIVDEGIRYNPEITEFSATMSLLDETVKMYVEEHGAENVSVMLAAFSEALQVMQSASDYESLRGVQWFGTAANAREYKIINDPIGKEFANDVGFTTIQIAATNNDLYNRVNSSLSSQFAGKEPNGYAFTSYDAMWVLGMSILRSDSNEVDTLKRVIPAISERNFGAIGTTTLNEAGDLAGTDYDLWAIIDGEWVTSGKYFIASDTILIERQTGVRS